MSDRPIEGGSVLPFSKRQRLTREGPGEAWTDASFEVLREPTHGGGSGGGTEMLEPRVAKLEADLGHVLRDVAEVRTDLKVVGKDVAEIKATLAVLTERIGHLAASKEVAGVKTDVATLTERSAHLATKASVYGVAISLLGLATLLGTAVVTYAPKLRQWAGADSAPPAASARSPVPPPGAPSR